MEKSSNKITNKVGIDISKDKYDVAFRQADGGYKTYQFDNNPSGFRAFTKLLPTDSHCIMEATGVYGLQLSMYLQTHEIRVSVVNPLVIKRFCQMRMTRAKTDKKDAIMICQYGEIENPPLWLMPSNKELELKQLHALLEQISKNLTAYGNQLKSFEQAGVKSSAIKLCKGEIKHLQKQKAQIMQDIEDLAKDLYGDAINQITSIKGIGKKTAVLLLVSFGGFVGFDTHKQVTSYCGFAPRIFESGTSVKGKARICKMGMTEVRKNLYICAWSAIRYNPQCKEYYERLIANGKPKKVALIAVANKLLRIAFALVKKERMFDDKFISKKVA